MSYTQTSHMTEKYDLSKAFSKYFPKCPDPFD